MNINSQKKVKRQTIALEKKIRILKRLSEGKGSSAVAKEFQLSESTVRAIQKRASKIYASLDSATNDSSKRASYSRNIVIEKTEKAVVLWIKDLIKTGIPVRKELIKETARAFFNRLKDLEPSSSSKVVFSASNGWFAGFLQRYELKNLKIQDEASLEKEMIQKQPAYELDIVKNEQEGVETFATIQDQTVYNLSIIKNEQEGLESITMIQDPPVFNTVTVKNELEELVIEEQIVYDSCIDKNEPKEQESVTIFGDQTILDSSIVKNKQEQESIIMIQDQTVYDSAIIKNEPEELQSITMIKHQTIFDSGIIKNEQEELVVEEQTAYNNVIVKNAPEEPQSITMIEDQTIFDSGITKNKQENLMIQDQTVYDKQLGSFTRVEEQSDITADEIYIGIQIAEKLEAHFLNIDTNAERRLKFQNDLRLCMSHYRDMYNQLTNTKTDF